MSQEPFVVERDQSYFGYQKGEDLPTYQQMGDRLDQGADGIPLQSEPRSDVGLHPLVRREEELHEGRGRHLAREMELVMEKERLEKIVDGLGLREQIHAGMTKAEIAQCCARAYLEPERLKKTMLLLSYPLHTYELILKVARGMGDQYGTQDEREAEQLEEIGDLCFWYTAVSGDSVRYYIPADAAAAILELDTPEFRKWREDRFRVAACARLVPAIYGVISLHAFGRICRRDPDFSCRDEEVRDILDELQTLGPLGREAIAQGRLVVSRELQEDHPQVISWLSQRGQGMRFYQPSEEEIEEIRWNACLDSPQQRRLVQFLRAEIPALSEKEREEVLDDLRWSISLSDWMNLHLQCADLVEKYGLSERQDRELERLVVDLYNHSHVCMHQGFTPLQRDEPIFGLLDRDGEAGSRH